MRARVIESASVWGGRFAIARTLDWSKWDCGESPMLGFCERAMRFHCQLKLWQIDIHSTYGFPNVFGFFDGALIRIQAPTEQEQEFVARKGYHAINVQVRTIPFIVYLFHVSPFMEYFATSTTRSTSCVFV